MLSHNMMIFLGMRIHSLEPQVHKERKQTVRTIRNNELPSARGSAQSKCTYCVGEKNAGRRRGGSVTQSLYWSYKFSFQVSHLVADNCL